MRKKMVYFATYLITRRVTVRSLFKVCLIVKLIMLNQFTFAQQDPQFSQLFFNQAFVNPGYAGSDATGLYEALALNRSQITGFEGASGTTIINVNGPLNLGGTPGGVTFSMSNDKVGYLTKTSIDLGYAYRLALNKGSLGLGLSLGMFFSTMESGGWRLPDGGGDDVAIPTSKGTKQNFDLGVGCFYTYDKWYAGFSCTHLNEPAFIVSDKASNLKRNYYFSGGYQFALPNPNFEISPSFLIHTDLSSTLYTFNALAIFKEKYWGGLNYRIGNSVGLLIGLNLFPEFRVGYCYEYNTSALSKFSGGNHEIMLSYRFAVFIDKGKQKFKSIRYL